MRLVVLYVAVLVALAACGPRVQINAERSTIATFGGYDTYAWALPAAPARSAGETEASVVEWRIRNAVDRVLATKGYVRTDGPASLLVDYDVAAPDSFREYFRNLRRGGSTSFAEGYEEGTLVVHLVDARTRVLAYRASATGVIEQNGGKDRVEEAVERMFANLPAVMPSRGRR
jgi:Domain of unknown function (DUF4136)